MKTISISLYNRPLYTKTLLDSLQDCHGFNEYFVRISVEPVNIEVINLAKDFVERNSNATIFINPERFGCNQNILVSISRCFKYSDYNIHLEDDTIPGYDCLDFFNWAGQKYYTDKSILNISGYVNSNNQTEHYSKKSEDISKVFRRQWFTPWGWATWKDRFLEMRDGWDCNGINGSWDCTINGILRKDRSEIYPAISRIQNIGAELGTHVPTPEWHAEHHYNEYWIESVGRYTRKFYE